MKMSQNVKPALIGMVAGIAICALVGFQWGGWVTAGTAQEKAETAANEATVSALTPQCVAQGLADEARLAEIMAESSYNRRKLIGESGWSSRPEGASTKLTRMLDEACLKGLTATS